MDQNGVTNRITVDPKVMVGQPVIRGTRLSVQFIVGLLAKGSSIEDILSEYKGLEEEDVRACLAFAAHSLEASEYLPFPAA